MQPQTESLGQRIDFLSFQQRNLMNKRISDSLFKRRENPERSGHNRLLFICREDFYLDFIWIPFGHLIG